MKDSAADYVRIVRALYLELPITGNRFTLSDRLLAQDLFRRQIPIETPRNALLLGAALRLCRNPSAPPLEPVRSLHYFLPLLEEVRRNPLPPSYVQYLEAKIRERTVRV